MLLMNGLMQGKDSKKDISSVKSVAPAPSKEAGGRGDPKVFTWASSAIPCR